MAKVTVNKEKCKGCGLCVSVCPKKVLYLSETQLNSKGFHPCAVNEDVNCSGCTSCYIMCPDWAITVEK
ncbi:MAG: 4Fe-4S binding protein [Clostridia bacterium]|nr:4Fe-4S binding protein [Clostridia bacterium]